MTASNEIVQQSGKVANGYKTILVNLMTKDLEKQFNAFGLTMLDTNEELKDGYTIIKELSGVYKMLGETWDEDSESMASLNDQMNALLEDIAGKHNINVLVAGLQNFDTAISATTSALNSAGSAQDEYATALDGIDKKLDALKGQFQELVWGDGGLNNLIKLLLDAGIAILKFANSDVGQTVVKVGALAASFIALNVALKSTTAIKIGKWFETAFIAVKDFKGGVISLNAALNLLKINPVVIALTAAVAVTYAVAKASDALNESLEETKERMEGLQSEVVTAESSMKTIEGQLEVVNQKIIDINSLDGTKVAKEGELEALIAQRKELETNYIIEKNRYDLAQKQLEIDALKVLNAKSLSEITPTVEKDVTQYDRTNTPTTVTMDVANMLTPVERVEEATEALKVYAEQIEELGELSADASAEEIEAYEQKLEAINENIEAAKQQGDTALQEAEKAVTGLGEESESYNLVKNAADGLSDALSGVGVSVDNSTTAIQANAGAMEDEAEITGDVTDEVQQLANALGIEKSELQALASSANMSEQQLVNLSNSMGMGIQQTSQYASTMDGFNSSLDSIQSAYGTLTSAVDEYNSMGGYSIDTLQNLLALSPEYLGALQMENGQLVLNEEALKDKVTAEAEEAKQGIYNAGIAKIKQLADEKAQGATENSATASSNAVNSHYDNAAAMKEEAGAALMLKAAADASKKGVSKAEIDEVTGWVKDMFGAIDSSVANLGKNFSGTMTGAAKSAGRAASGGAKSAAKAAKDTTDTYKKEFDTQLADLDHLLKMELISQQEYYNKLKELNEKYFGEASGQHEKYIDTYKSNEEKLYDTLKKIREDELSDYETAISYINKTYDKRIENIRKDKEEELNSLDSQIERIEKRKESELDALDEQIEKVEEEKDVKIDSLEEQIDKIEEEKDAALDSIDEQIDRTKEAKKIELDLISDKIDALKEEHKEQEKITDAQIDSLEELKDKEKEEWDAKIEAYKEQNKLLEDQNELERLQENLAEARSKVKKVFKGGQFVFGQDEEAIEDAEKAIEDYYTERKQEEELKALEDARDAALNSYSKQIEDLKKYKEAMKEEYEKRLEDMELYYDSIEEKYNSDLDNLENYKDKTEEAYDAEIANLKNYVEKTKEEYDLEIDNLEAHREAVEEQFDARLEHLREYRYDVEAEYDEQIADMEHYQQEFEDMINAYQEEQDRLLTQQLLGTKSESDNWTTRLSNLSDFVNRYNKLQGELDSGGGSSGGDSGDSDDGSDSSKKDDDYQGIVEGIHGGPGVYEDSEGNIHFRASGDSSIKESGAYVVGEDPNQEVVIGSKLNNGTLMKLNKGDGVVNAQSTKTLAGLLNTLGASGGVQPSLVESKTNTIINQYDKLVLPSVTDGNAFVEYMSNYKNLAIQRGNSRN